jgi:hypothetical protein
MDTWATLDVIRTDLKRRSEQIQVLWGRIQALGQKIDAFAAELSALEEESSGRKRRRGRPPRRGPCAPGPTVVELAVQILHERGSPMPCVELARAIKARGCDTGNNERSLRMSASKGRRLRQAGDDVIALAHS